jgi:hypothetical protein
VGAEKNVASPAPSLRPLAPVEATTELEVEVLRLLNQAKADLGEQVSVTRTPEGQLRVQALVETEKRKSEIGQALSAVANHPAVKIEVETVAEALRLRPPGNAATSPVVVESAEATVNAIPADSELRRYISGRGLSGRQLEEEIRRFADRALGRSREALQHARALKSLVNRFSVEQLQALAPEGRAKWLALIRGHAQTLRQETTRLRQELSPVFWPSAPAAETDQEIPMAGAEELMRAAERLLELCTAHDRVISAAFAISPNTERAAAVKDQQFERSLRRAESLAAKIQNPAPSDK